MKETAKIFANIIQALRIDKKPSKMRWTNGDFRILAKNADEYLKMMNLAFEHGIYTQVLHNGHIAVELLMKGAFAKYCKNLHPFGHEIFNMLKEEINGQAIALAIKVDPVIEDAFNTVSTAWDMQDRYKKKGIEKTESQQYLIEFKKASEWIKRQYVL